MAAFEVLALDTATPQIRAPGAADTYTFPRAITPSGANVTPFTVSGYSLTGANAQSMFDLSGTWNTSGTPTALKLNITDTASAAGSLLMDLQVGGSSRFNVSKSGRVAVTGGYGFSSAPNANYGFVGYSTGWYWNDSGGVSLGFVNSKFMFPSGGTASGFGWGNLFAGTYDLALAYDAANTLAQRNATNAQTFRVYNTFTNATNFQRLGVTSASTTLSALSGASVTATNLIPAGAVVVGVTTRVSTEITGASGYQVGTVADPDRWGDITGTAVGTTSDNTNWTAGTIECFTAASDVVITAKTSNFTGGAIVVVIHYLIGQAD